MEDKFQTGDCVILNVHAVALRVTGSKVQYSKYLTKVGDANSGIYKSILKEDLVDYITTKNTAYSPIALDKKKFDVFNVTWYSKNDINKKVAIIAVPVPENCLLPYLLKPIREEEENQITPINLDL